MSMFTPKENPAFNELVTGACKALVNSIDKSWYNSATRPVEEVDENPPENEDDRNRRETESPFMGGDDVVVVE